ncbi:MAG: outer membrane lipoprotein-sorting protein [Mariprofundus sp.]|nr:outer membrane lipoprotein-sorting protein [Mariprofundus sp.]
MMHAIMPAVARFVIALLCLGASAGIAEAVQGFPGGDSAEQIRAKINEQVKMQARLAGLSGKFIIDESLKRHELYPYVYEEQTLILMDERKQRDVRRIRRYSRMDPDHVLKTKLEFVYPETISGTILLFVRPADGGGSSRIFLPALGGRMINYVGAISGGQLLGSEFSLQDLLPEDMRMFDYQRESDVVIDEQTYFSVRASVKHSDASVASSQQSNIERLLLIRQDNFYVVRVDYFNNQGLLTKRQMRHDIHHVGGQMWRADMISVVNFTNHHRSILKIDRRVFSRDYVPEAAFNENKLLLKAQQKAGAGSEARNKPQAEVHRSTPLPADAEITNREEKP